MIGNRQLQVALLGAILIVAAACSKPAPSVPAAPIWQPRPGTCHEGFANYLSAATYDEKNCDEPHTYQTVYVTEFEGDLERRSAPPESTLDAKDAWAACDKKLTAFLGGEWRARKMLQRVGMPTAKAWTDGARWFSCETATANFGAEVTSVSRSFSGAFTTMPEIEFGCADVTLTGDAATKRCDEPHNAEYVGYIVLDMSYKAFLAESEEEEEEGKITRDCRSMVADFLNVSTDRTGVWAMSFGEDEWEKGDRAVRCFLWLEDANVSKSLKGVGASGLPLK